MRAGGCTVQQALTPEAANVVKQAVTLARRRGHAQVTPLHVANTMLTSSTGLFRTACLQSHSHPLQSRALELCFNVALNRLPASSSSPILGAHISQQPSISNALVAAFKRAQAHQRRGSIENQQQPILSVKIELEQLIISILDDPSVSRVMREAGFSSTQVKTNVEQAISSMEMSSQNKPKENNVINLSQSPPVSQTGSKAGKPTVSDPVRDEDIMHVIENLVNRKRKSTVIVGECLASIEGVVKGVMEKVDKGDVPEALKNVKFTSLSLPSFKNQSRVEIQHKIEEIKSLLSNYMGSGIILFLGDLKWVAEYRAIPSVLGKSYYCPVEDLLNEIGKLVCRTGDSGKFWLMGIATFQAYMKCKTGNPSLEAVLSLHPLTIPAGSLRLSLVTDSDMNSQMTSNKVENGSSWFSSQGEEDMPLNCCADCSAKFKAEVQSSKNSTCNIDSTSSSLPAWLKQYKEENRGQSNSDQDCVSVRDLCKKWNSICSSSHRQSNSAERTIAFSSISPSSSTSAFSYEQQNSTLHNTHHDFWLSAVASKSTVEPSRNDLMQALSSNPNSTPNSASPSDNAMEVDYAQKFKELNAENLKTLCDALEKKVPWQKDIIPEIVSTILRCRSRLVKRKGISRNNEVKEETWLFFQGIDMEAKEKIARELAKLIFGSHENYISIALSSFSSTRADSSEECRNKRSRNEHSGSYIERFAEAVSCNPHRVFFVEDIEQADYTSQMGFKRAIENGRITNSNGEEVLLRDAIVILSCDSFSSRSRACSPTSKQKFDCCEGAAMEETSPCVSLDLNISIDDDSIDKDESIDEIGLLESVDRRIVFKIQEIQ